METERVESSGREGGGRVGLNRGVKGISKGKVTSFGKGVRGVHWFGASLMGAKAISSFSEL